MEPAFVAGIAVVATLIVVRRYATRQIAARRAPFVWLLFLPTLFGAVAILWAAFQLSRSEPIAAATIAIVGALYLALVLRFLTRLTRAVASAGPQDDLLTAVAEPIADHMITIISLVLIGGVVALAGLIVWAVSRAT